MTDTTDRKAAVLAVFLKHPDQELYYPEIVKGAGLKLGTGYAELAWLEQRGWVTSGWEQPTEPVTGLRRWYKLVNGWKYLRNGDLPPEGVTIETVDSGGCHRDLVYEHRLWWFPDRSMYVYYTPQAWRLKTFVTTGRG